jgi:hypothetical protein
MNLSVIAFLMMASATVLFMAATLAGEWPLKLPAPHRTNHSSQSRRFVFWLSVLEVMLAAIMVYLV